MPLSQIIAQFDLLVQLVGKRAIAIYGTYDAIWIIGVERIRIWLTAAASMGHLDALRWLRDEGVHHPPVPWSAAVQAETHAAR